MQILVRSNEQRQTYDSHFILDENYFFTRRDGAPVDDLDERHGSCYNVTTGDWSAPFSAATINVARFSYIAETAETTVKLQADNGDADLFVSDSESVSSVEYLK